MHYRPTTWGLIGAVVVLINALFDMVGISIPNLGVLMLLNELIIPGAITALKGIQAIGHPC